MTQRPAILRATIDLCRLVHEHNASLQICMHYYNKRLLIKWIFLITAALISCKLVIIKGPTVPLHLSESHLWASPAQLLLHTLQFSCGLLGGTPKKKKKKTRLASGQRFECWVKSLGFFLLPGLRLPVLHRLRILKHFDHIIYSLYYPFVYLPCEGYSLRSYPVSAWISPGAGRSPAKRELRPAWASFLGHWVLPTHMPE